MAGPPPPPYGKTWVKVWSDEFDGDALNDTKWTPRPERSHGCVNQHGFQICSRREHDNVAVRDGKLALRNTRKRLSPKSYEVANAAIWTQDTFQSRYGYFEARVKIPPTKDGCHFALWLQSHLTFTTSQNGGVDGAADGAEIDILESLFLDHINPALHWDQLTVENRKSASEWLPLRLNDGRYHVYAVDWNAKRYRFYVDGRLIWTYSGRACPKATSTSS